MAKKKSLHISYGLLVMILSLLLVIGTVMSALFVFNSVSSNEESISVNSKANIDYNVYLKENSYYEGNVLPANMKYIASLIDYIDTNISYNITSTDLLDYDYSYAIEAITRVYGDNSKSKVLFEKSSPLVSEQKLSVVGTDKVVIQENIKIDYDKYNSLISSFKTSYGLSSVSDVTIVLHVIAKAKCGDASKYVNINEDSELIIPLTEQTIDVQLTTNPGNTYSVLTDNNKFVVSNRNALYIGIVTIILSIIILIILLIMFVKKFFNRHSRYKRALNRILRENDLIIANVDYDIDEDNYTIVKALSFSELRDIHDNIGQPILFKELKKNHVASFVIIKDKFLYKYVLNILDF